MFTNDNYAIDLRRYSYPISEEATNLDNRMFWYVAGNLRNLYLGPGLFIMMAQFDAWLSALRLND